MNKKKEAALDPQQGIKQSTLEDIMAERFARYSKYIIQERALPDARDGLKPVQRRILYAMFESKNTFDRPYHKSAKTVGNVIGNYHPHGDSSVYDAMVRLSQNWKITTPLIDMQGNNGSIDDDPAAAMRYTEARLSKLSNYMLEDIDKETVEWAPNFSDEKMEPTVLPARFPNLLINGISGIAAGYATNIPPHNLNEIVAACMYRIEHPTCSLEEIMSIVKGPDFPTGGIVMGQEGIEQAFRTGRGRIIVRSRVHLEQSKTIKKIVVTEIPYDVVKSNLVKKIDEIRMNKNIDGILDVRDESDRNGLKIVIDLKKELNEELILNYLYKNTDLQVAFNYNTIAIVNKSPVQLGLIPALDAFLHHREQVVLRRSHFDLKKKESRQHILEGLIRAVSIMDEIIQLIRSSKDKKEAKLNLIDRFAFSQAQAEAIVTMRLYRLTNTDIVELKGENKLLKQEIQTLKQIIQDQTRRNQVLIEELKEINEVFVTPRRSLIEEKIEEIVIDPLDMIPSEQVMVALSRDGYAKRVSLRSFNASSDLFSGKKEGDQMVVQGEANTRDTLLFFTNKGTYGYVPIFQLEEKKWKDIGSHLSSVLKMEANEKIIQAFVLDSFSEKVQAVLASRSGFIKRTSLKNLETSRMNKEMVVMKVGEQDEVVEVQISYSADDEVLLASQNGLGLRYSVREIPESGPKTKGVKAMNFAAHDGLADFVLGDENKQWLIVLKGGKMKRMQTSDFAQLKRPGKGIHLFKIIKSNPGQIERLLLAEQKYSLLINDPIEFDPQTLSLMTPAQTYSSPFGQEAIEWNFPLTKIHEGSWAPKQDNVQEKLFDEA